MRRKHTPAATTPTIIPIIAYVPRGKLSIVLVWVGDEVVLVGVIDVVVGVEDDEVNGSISEFEKETN